MFRPKKMCLINVPTKELTAKEEAKIGGSRRTKEEVGGVLVF